MFYIDVFLVKASFLFVQLKVYKAKYAILVYFTFELGIY